MSVLVVGGLGYIGSNVSKMLLENKEDVIILDNLSNSHIGKAKLLKDITNKPVKLYTKDLLKEKDIVQVFKENQIESVIYAAESQAKNSKDYIKESILMLTNLLEVMNTFSCKRLIFTSSEIYLQNPKIKEISGTINILSDYPLKLRALKIQEMVITDFFKENSKEKWSISILRLFNASGSDSSGMLGDVNLNRNDIFTRINRYIINKEKLTLNRSYVTSYDGTLIRDFIHIIDVSRAYLKTLELIRKSNDYLTTINICSGKPTSESQVIRLYKAISGTDIKYENVTTGETMVNTVSKNEKAIQLLKFEPHYSLDTIVKSNIEFCNNYSQILKDFKASEDLLKKKSKKSEEEKDDE